MRFSGWFGPTAVELAFVCLLSGTARAVNFSPVTSPDLDLSQLGRVALTGDFDSISLYSYQGQNENGFTTNGSQSLLTQMPNGAFATLVASDAMIMAMCPYVRGNGDFEGIIIGGNFTSLSGTPAQGAALWNPTSNKVTPLPGLNGSVNAVYCDKDSVYFGGDFNGGNSSNAIQWLGMTGWSNMPFQGFNGPVNSIVKAPDGKVVFGGSFTGLGDTTTPTNKDQQVINLSSANVSGSNTDTDGFSNPQSIVCNTDGTEGAGSTWLTPDGGGGFWQAYMNFAYQPTKLRIWNTHFEGRGTKVFRLTAFPLNGIMNLTYVDPDTGKNASCDNNCPLSSDTAVKYQDFHFVNTVGMDAFKIDLKEWYGNGAGLNGIELFQDDIYTYAVSDLNEPSCSGADFPSNSTKTGAWAVSPSLLSTAQYLTVNLTDKVNTESAEVTFLPDIKQSGNYSVIIYTPGCEADNSCSSRGTANVTGIYSNGGRAISSQITQTNDFDKYDQIFHGYVDANSDSFRPKITLSPGQDSALNLVALRVKFQLLGASSSGLNGIFEYDPDVATVGSDFTNNTFDTAGTDLDTGAIITSMAVIDQTTYLGGNLTSSNVSNIFAITDGKAESVANGGLNNPVSTLFPWGNLLFAAGNFTDTVLGSTAGIKHVAVYDTVAKSWSPLGGGVNGPVSDIVPLSLNITAGKPETCITVNGHFTSVLTSGSKPSFSASGFAIWVPSRNDWLNNLDVQAESIHGQLTAAANVSGSTPLLAGTISSQGWALSDSVALSSQGDISPIGLKLPASTSSSSKLRKRATDPISRNVTGAITGLFVTDNNRNLTVLAGQFEATASSGSTINNLAIINATENGNVITGLSSGVDSDSTFRSVSRNEDVLAVGGQLTGTVGGEKVAGLILWDLGSSDFVSPQPAPLTGDEVGVYAITTRPSSDDLYVGGNFTGAGLTQCPSLCVYTSNAWSRPGLAVEGTVSAMMWQGNDDLLIGGELMVSSNNTYLATYEPSNKQAYSIPDGASIVPGPVTAIAPGTKDGSAYWVAGSSAKNDSAYLIYYTGTKFETIPKEFGSGTTIRGLSVLSVAKEGYHTANSFVDESFLLMITGNINVPGFGNASAVLFNGTDLTPYILSNTGNGPGSLSQVITENQQEFKAPAKGLALGFVVLIALAIALGVMFLLVAIGLLLERRRKKAEGYRPAPQNYFEKTANMGRIPPERLFSSLNPPNTTPRV